MGNVLVEKALLSRDTAVVGLLITRMRMVASIARSLSCIQELAEAPPAPLIVTAMPATADACC